MGVKCRNEWEMETGQMFIDKKLHLDVFLLVKYMLERHEWVSHFLSAVTCLASLAVADPDCSGSGSRMVTRISLDGHYSCFENDGLSLEDG